MIEKISKIVFWVSIGLDLVSIIDRGINMLDMRLFLELGILVIAIVSGFIYLSEKRKQIKNKMVEYELIKRWIGFPDIKYQENSCREGYHNLMEAIEVTIDRRLKDKGLSPRETRKRLYLMFKP